MVARNAAVCLSSGDIVLPDLKVQKEDLSPFSIEG